MVALAFKSKRFLWRFMNRKNRCLFNLAWMTGIHPTRAIPCMVGMVPANLTISYMVGMVPASPTICDMAGMIPANLTISCMAGMIPAGKKLYAYYIHFTLPT